MPGNNHILKWFSFKFKKMLKSCFLVFNEINKFQISLIKFYKNQSDKIKAIINKTEKLKGVVSI